MPTIYTTKICPNCKMLKQILEQFNMSYKEVNISTAESLTELSINNVFTRSAPVLRIKNKFYTVKELCTGNDIDKNKVVNIIKKVRE